MKELKENLSNILTDKLFDLHATCRQLDSVEFWEHIQDTAEYVLEYINPNDE